MALLLGAAAVAVGVVLPLAMSGRPPAAEERAARVRPGMTRAEVEAALGGPPGDYTPGQVYARTGDTDYEDDPYRFGVWLWDAGVLDVWFDVAGRVEETRYTPSPSAPAGLARLRAWVGW